MSKSTRQKILETTSALLEKQGYHATGLNQIVAESDTPRGSLYYYFPEGKEELVSEAITLRMEEVTGWMQQFLASIADPIEAFYAMIMKMSQQTAQSGCSSGAPIAAVALEASNNCERIRKVCAVSYQRAEDVFAARLVVGGVPAEKAASLASTINAAIEGAMIISRTKQDVAVLVHVADYVKLILQNAIYG